MVPGSHTRLHVRGLTLLLLCLGLISLLPGRSNAASSIASQQIDNTQGEFADGNFQRTSIGSSKLNITPTGSDLPDLEGLVQLAPAGVLNNWNAPYHLPTPTSEMGVTAVGKHIYVIGGTDNNGFSSAAWRAQIDPTTGAFVDTGSGLWTNSPMPAAVTIANRVGQGALVGCETPTAKRTRVGVASVTTGTDTGYIYVIGGAVNPSALSCVTGGFSTPLVQRGTVAANGAVTWATLSVTTTSGIYVPSPLDIPSDDGVTNSDYNLGVEGASVVIVHTKSGTGEHYYLYVIGGKSRYVDPTINTATLVRALATVYYTEINMADGSLKHPATGSTSIVWKRDRNIPLVTTPVVNEGLWDAAATATSVLSGTTALRSAIFLTGGSFDADNASPNPTNLNPYIYRADVNPDTGVLTWGTGVTGNTTQIALGSRRGMVSVSYDNKLYMVGGRTGDTQDTSVATVPTAFLNDNLDLIKIFNSDYFVGTNTDVLIDSGSAPRSSLGVAVVRAEPPTGVISGTLNTAWVYVVGGTNKLNVLQDSIFVGRIGGDDAAASIRTPDGWYYSGVIKTSFAFGTSNLKARVLAFHWATNIDRSRNTDADVEIQFRKTITASGECPDNSVFSSTSASDAWSPSLDGFPNNPLYSLAAVDTNTFYNTTAFSGTQNLDASCIQYRAHLMQDAKGLTAQDPSNSPQLLSIYVEKEISGNADVNIPANGFSVTTTSNRISSSVMKIQNLNANSVDLTLAVPEVLAASSPPVYGGNFYILLCKAYTAINQNPPPSGSLVLPDPSISPFVMDATTEARCPAFASILNSEMQRGSTVDLLQSKNTEGNTRWSETRVDTASGRNLPISDIMSLFTANGHYQIGLVIDPGNFVPEGALGTAGETNNRSGLISFTVSSSSTYIVMLPMVTR